MLLTKVFAKAGLENVTSAMCKHQRRFGLDVQFSVLVYNFNNKISNGHLYWAGQSINSLPSQILQRWWQFCRHPTTFKDPENMTRVFNFTTALLLLLVCQTSAQTSDSLRQKIQQIISTRNATVGVSIVGSNGKDTLSINGEGHFPMQSVFKFHIALAVLSQIDKGRWSLYQKIKIEKKDLLPGLHSPLREKYPNGATLPLVEIIRYTVSNSDNVGCDALLRLLGGPQEVEKYLLRNGFKDISIKINEEVMQNNWELQFQNWTTPKAASNVLASFYYNQKKLLSPKSYDFVWKEMRENETGKNRLKRLLPEGTVVAHKTGSSGKNKATGITAAVNDIGIVFLPNGKYFFISVFVSNSKEDFDTNEKIIAEISKAAWDYFTT